MNHNKQATTATKVLPTKSYKQVLAGGNYGI